MMFQIEKGTAGGAATLHGLGTKAQVGVLEKLIRTKLLTGRQMAMLSS